jgi:hypothetical protein
MGTLAFLQRATAADGVLFGFTSAAGETFDTATLHLLNLGTGTELTSSATTGANWVPAVPTGRYVGWVDEYDAGLNLLRHTRPILFSVTSTDTSAGLYTVSFRGDENSWVDRQILADLTRRSIFSGEACHRYRWKVQNLIQNKRMILRSVNFHLRQQGRSASAENTD